MKRFQYSELTYFQTMVAVGMLQGDVGFGDFFFFFFFFWGGGGGPMVENNENGKMRMRKTCETVSLCQWVKS